MWFSCDGTLKSYAPRTTTLTFQTTLETRKRKRRTVRAHEGLHIQLLTMGAFANRFHPVAFFPGAPNCDAAAQRKSLPQSLDSPKNKLRTGWLAINVSTDR